MKLDDDRYSERAVCSQVTTEAAVIRLPVWAPVFPDVTFKLALNSGAPNHLLIACLSWVPAFFFFSLTLLPTITPRNPLVMSRTIIQSACQAAFLSCLCMSVHVHKSRCFSTAAAAWGAGGTSCRKVLLPLLFFYFFYLLSCGHARWLALIHKVPRISSLCLQLQSSTVAAEHIWRGNLEASKCFSFISFYPTVSQRVQKFLPHSNMQWQIFQPIIAFFFFFYIQQSESNWRVHSDIQTNVVQPYCR